MAELIKARWEQDPALGLPRSARRGCDYEAYVPDPLAGRALRLERATAADVADAELAIAELNRDVRALANSEALARLLLRAESVASSKIEGLEVGGRRLLEASSRRELGDARPDVTRSRCSTTSRRWLGRRRARATGGASLSTTCSRSTNGFSPAPASSRIGGTVAHGPELDRRKQLQPVLRRVRAAAARLVEELLDDLCAFCNDDAIPAVAQAAIAHAQFETIHPFVDGNGRTGRALIHVILRRRGLAPTFVPPISLVLATWAADYIEGLTARATSVRPTADAARTRRLGRVVRRRVPASRRRRARYEQQVARAQSSSGAPASDACDAAPRPTCCSTPCPARRCSRCRRRLPDRPQRAGDQRSDRAPADAGVLSQITSAGATGRSKRESSSIAFTALERQLASPDADTRASPPARRVPRRPAT